MCWTWIRIHPSYLKFVPPPRPGEHGDNVKTPQKKRGPWQKCKGPWLAKTPMWLAFGTMITKLHRRHHLLNNRNDCQSDGNVLGEAVRLLTLIMGWCSGCADHVRKGRRRLITGLLWFSREWTALTSQTARDRVYPGVKCQRLVKGFSGQRYLSVSDLHR